MKKIIILLILAVLIAAAGVAGVYVWKQYKLKTAGEAERAAASFGEEIYDKIKNPAENMPKTNPYETKTNPFEGAKTNPYENIYQNPFGE